MTFTPEQRKIYMREYRKKTHWKEYFKKYQEDRDKIHKIRKRYFSKLKEKNHPEIIARWRYRRICKKGEDNVRSEYEILSLLVKKLKRRINEQGLSKAVLSQLRDA